MKKCWHKSTIFYIDIISWISKVTIVEFPNESQYHFSAMKISALKTEYFILELLYKPDTPESNISSLEKQLALAR